MDYFAQSLDSIEGLNKKDKKFLAGIRELFTKEKREDYIFLISRNLILGGKYLDLVVKGHDAKGDILRFATENSCPIPNVHIRKSKIGDFPIYLDESKNFFDEGTAERIFEDISKNPEEWR